MKTGTTGRTFNIVVGKFQGSLETLLDMVQKRKMHISDVSLAQVADDYVAYVRSIKSASGDILSAETANFIVVAATLLLIKSKSLLPTLALSMEEEESIKDLEERLRLYSIYRQASDVLAQYTKDNKRLYAPKHIKGEKSSFIPGLNLNLDVLHMVMGQVLGQLPKMDNKPKVEITEAVNIEEVMQSLLERVEGAVQQSFSDISGTDKQEVLVNFLALLELVKDGVFLAEQGSTYGDIMLTKPYVSNMIV